MAAQAAQDEHQRSKPGAWQRRRRWEAEDRAITAKLHATVRDEQRARRHERDISRPPRKPGGRPCGAGSSHCSARETRVRNRAQTWPVLSPAVVRPARPRLH